MYYTDECMKTNKKDQEIVSKSLKEIITFMKRLSEYEKRLKKANPLVR